MPDHLSYILALLSHILSRDSRRVEVFLGVEDKKLIQTFQRIWARDDLTIIHVVCAAIILGQAYTYEQKLKKDKNESKNNNNNDNNNSNEQKTDNEYEMKKDEYASRKYAYRQSRYKSEYKLLCQWTLREFKKRMMLYYCHYMLFTEPHHIIHILLLLVCMVYIKLKISMVQD